jgi:hypothetical protein
MKIYILDYETDSDKGYKLIEASNLSEAYSAALEWFNNQPPCRYLKVKIIGDHNEPFKVI